MPNSYRDQQLLMQSLGMLGDAMRKMKEEEQYNRILNELDPPRAGTADGRIPTEKPHRGGRIEYELWRQQQQMERQQQQDVLNEEFRRAQIQRALRPSRSEMLIGPDGLTPYQRMQIELSRTREERLSKGSSADPEGQLEKEMFKRFGLEPDEISSLEDVDIVNERGERVNDLGVPIQVDPESKKEMPVEGAKPSKVFVQGNIGDRTIRMPREQARPYINRYKALLGQKPAADATATVVRPQVGLIPPAPMPTKQDKSVTIPAQKASEADSIRAAFKAGTITREEAKAKLAALVGQ